MEVLEFNALCDRLHNQSIEIKRLKAELERARKAYQRLQVYRSAERKMVQETSEVERRKTHLWKRMFMRLRFPRQP